MNTPSASSPDDLSQIQKAQKEISSIQPEPGSGLDPALAAANLNTLEEFFENRTIRLKRGSLFEVDQSPISPKVSFDKIEGMLLGLAIGDALGITTEGMTPGSRRSQYGEIRDYLPNKYTGRHLGYPSDDSQMAFWTLDHLNQHHGLNPEALGFRFAKGHLYGIGATVRGFQSFIKGGTPWYQSGPNSAGNGALMRIAPILIPHLRTGGKALWADTTLASMMTHNDSASTAACLAFIAILWELLEMESPPEPSFWLSRYTDIARELEGDSKYRARGGNFTDYEGPIWEYTEERINFALKHAYSVLEAGYGWFSGAYLMETIPSVLYILTKHGHDPEEAIIRAVNDTKDNDTIAAIVGAAVGALHGKAALPGRWLENLTGRTTDADDGMMFEIIGKARRIFWE